MNQRRVTLLFIAAFVVIALAAWLSTRVRSDGPDVAGQPALPELKKALNDVTELRFSKGDGAHTTLRRQAGEWLVVERGYAADAARARKLLLDAAAVTVVEEKTSSPERYATLGVEDTATKLEIVTPAKTWGVIVGKSAGAKSGYLRVAGAKQSLLVSPRLEIDAEPLRWLDKTIANVPEARIRSVSIRPASGPVYEVSREKREQEDFTVTNVPKKRKLSHEGAGNALAGGLASLAMDDVRKAQTAAATATGVTVQQSRATFNTFDGLTVEVTGRKESAPGLKPEDPKVEHHYIALVATSTDKATQDEAQQLSRRAAGREFEVPGYKFDGLFKPLEELLEAPPAK